MKPEDIWQICFDDVLAGRKTPAECASLYPQLEDLEADLHRAVALQSMQTLTLSAVASQRLEARLRQRANELRAADAAARRPARLTWSPRWVLGPALAAALLLTGIGTTAAAGASNPGDLLYRVKRADESVQVLISPPSARADVYASLARRRLGEMAVVLQRGQVDAGTLNNLADDMTAETAAALAAVDQAPVERQADILNALVQLTGEQQTALATAEQAAPAEAQAGLRRAIQASTEEQARASARLEQGAAGHKPTHTPTSNATPTASLTPPATSPATATPPATGTVESATTAAPTGTATETPGQAHVPPGQTKVPPGQTHVPPGQTKVPPGQTHVPPGHTHSPPGQTNVPPGQTKIPPGQDKTARPTQQNGPDD
jgi:hypothetical protein